MLQCVSDCKRLPQGHPDVCAVFMNGEFVVATSFMPFSAISHQTLERFNAMIQRHLWLKPHETTEQ